VSGEKPREIALEVLLKRQTGAYVEDLLDDALSRVSLSSPDRGLCQELVYGVVRWQGTLDWLIDQKTDKRPQKPALRELLRLGLYQIFWLDRIPNHAAVNETVTGAKQRGFATQAGFINAILRGYIREEEVTRKNISLLKASNPALGYSHPGWLFDRWEKRWGREKGISLLGWDNTPPKTFARVNLLKADPAKLLTQWREGNVDYDFVLRDWFPENLVFELKSHPPLGGLPSFQQGLFYVQDPSTLLAVHALDPQPGENILDLCAAPGGKLTYIAQLVRNEARLVAYDTSASRLKLVEENCKRLGVTCVSLPERDPVPDGTALQAMPPFPAGSYDKIVIDAPCSNTGVLRRRVDLRWRVKPEEITRLRQVQSDLLNNAARMLKPGGVIVYSTCSLEPEENEDLLAEFLKSNGGFKMASQRALLPFADNVDGAFVAKLVRT
jgi:16S rRNA (cytosine967-C5)-methyltransferase